MSDWVGLGTVVSNLLDDVFTSDEERQQLANELAKIDNQRHAQVLALEGRIVELQGQVLAAQSQIITAEAKGESLLQRCWRPITMLTFLVLIVLDSFGVLAFRLSEQAWELLKLGIGGYVIGRTVEKAAPGVKSMAASAIQNLRKPNGHS
ncbi:MULTISPECIES: 3TM-type holin [unclassified Pseudoalteromonas]|uniref:3TM-type holin n=1 Tax=unclassified Pseudoalteromonas TaxID=194690 RepID=UPI001F29386C|nr:MULTISPECIES: 3TM-type holin [unclassified Pseudoalteromonas]MCF2829818.1 holin family protein [Pseudoalteromonas sp. OF5H-5]MCF2834587.1 holin family protein [Pseudoalteromonas sp. DL2-H6]MCF2927785.1 holin family protein [Pseudoalteromonas sp. DL2-H1]